MTLRGLTRSARFYWKVSRAYRFLVVGVWNFVFGYLCFAVTYWCLEGKLPDWMIVAIASVIGITNAFICHRSITYRSRGNIWAEYGKFYIVYGVQSVLNAILIWLFVTCWHGNAYLCQLLIAVSLTFVSYWGHKLFSFRNSVLR